jgi:hypothetical protein
LYASGVQGCWLPCGRAARISPQTGSRHVLPPSPGAFTPGSFSHEPFRPLQSTATCDLPPDTTSDLAVISGGAGSACHGVPEPSSRHHPAASTCRAEEPPPRYGPSPAFLTPSTVCATTGLAGLFHPAATSRVRPPRSLPRRGAVPAFTGRCPRAVGRPRLRLPAPAPTPSTSGPCSPRRVQRVRKTVKSTGTPRPSWAFALPGFRFPNRRSAFTPLPPATFTAMNPPQLALGVLPVQDPVCVGSRHRPA